VRFLAVPTVYGLIHVTVVLIDRVLQNPVEYARVTGGNPEVNLDHYLLYMFSAVPLAQAMGKFPYASLPDITNFTVVVALAVVLVAAFVARFASRWLMLMWL